MQDNDADTTRNNYMSWLQDVVSSDLQFHSIHMTNRSALSFLLFTCASN